MALYCDACLKEIKWDDIWVHIHVLKGVLPKSSVSDVTVCADEACVRLYLEWD
tara:strand:- start:2172 stop:2330 length:159 start_codon:yes stop_codon:yes gene_type:complete